MGSDRIVLAQAAPPGELSSVPWLVLGDRALPLSRWTGEFECAVADSIDALLASWETHRQELESLTTSPAAEARLLVEGADVALLAPEAPIRPRQVFCTIANYRTQVVEAAADAGDGACGRGAPGRRAQAEESLRRRREGGEPYICLTSPGRVTAPVAELPVVDPTLDWEVEIAAVLAHVTGDIDRANTPVIAGYCTANDITVRARVVRTDVPGLGSDWVQSKGLAGSLPLGPWFVPAWQVPEIAGLRLRLWVNGVLMQDDVAGDMLFSVAEQVVYLSRHVRVDAGDVICTGSPAGFGAHHRRYLRAGDVMVAEVSGLGHQELTCTEPSGADGWSGAGQPALVAGGERA
jgi:2,4-diketo-3-deoxy-L-fuconate hydrolase